jgi:5-methyltetrahydrofolate--homocysteine methyltransferase
MKDMSAEIIAQLRTAIIENDEQRSALAAQQGIGAGLGPLTLINQGIRTALDVLGERFSAGDLFLPELMLSALAADAAVAILEPELLKQGGAQNKLGKVLVATVKGDIHDIGKNIVALLMKSAGFDVIDLGVDKDSAEILAAARQHEVDVIGLSALLTTTMPHMQECILALKESGLREGTKVIVGGAPVTQEFADQIAADGYGADASRAVDITKQLLA